MPYPKRPASPPEMDAERARKAALHELKFTKNHPKQALGDYIFFGKHGNIGSLTLFGSQPFRWRLMYLTFPGWIWVSTPTK
ncbi:MULTISPECIES: hypothetical protein, partial [Pseudomonas syringae group]